MIFPHVRGPFRYVLVMIAICFVCYVNWTYLFAIFIGVDYETVMKKNSEMNMVQQTPIKGYAGNSFGEKKSPKVDKVDDDFGYEMNKEKENVMGHEKKNMSNIEHDDTQKKKPPHIVFFFADDMGWHDIGYHGSHMLTPTIDKLAATGVTLENYYVQPICSPSRTTLLTGRYNIHLGLQHDVIRPSACRGIPLTDTLIPGKLKQYGYKNYMVGKWHVGFCKNELLPMQRGFDKFLGIYVGMANHLTYLRNGKYSLVENNTPYMEGKDIYSTDLYTERSIQYMRDHVRDHPDKPLFLYVSYQAVHEPFYVPERYLKPYEHMDMSHTRLKLSGMTTCMDESMKNITDVMKELGIWENSVTVFSSDNGGPSNYADNYPLRLGKRTLFEGGVRAPAFVHSPLIKKPGRISRDLIHISDWLPTFVRLAGGTTEDLQLDGHDVWDTISLGSECPRKELLHNIDPETKPVGDSMYPDIFDTRIRAAIRVGDWKLITGDPYRPKVMKKEYMCESGKCKNVWLFNVAEDESEKNDLFYQHPDKVMELLHSLRRYNNTMIPYQELMSLVEAPESGEFIAPWV